MSKIPSAYLKPNINLYYIEYKSSIVDTPYWVMRNGELLIACGTLERAMMVCDTNSLEIKNTENCAISIDRAKYLLNNQVYGSLKYGYKTKFNNIVHEDGLTDFEDRFLRNEMFLSPSGSSKSMISILSEISNNRYYAYYKGSLHVPSIKVSDLEKSLRKNILGLTIEAGDKKFYLKCKGKTIFIGSMAECENLISLYIDQKFSTYVSISGFRQNEAKEIIKIVEGIFEDFTRSDAQAINRNKEIRVFIFSPGISDKDLIYLFDKTESILETFNNQGKLKVKIEIG